MYQFIKIILGSAIKTIRSKNSKIGEIDEESTKEEHYEKIFIINFQSQYQWILLYLVTFSTIITKNKLLHHVLYHIFSEKVLNVYFYI